MGAFNGVALHPNAKPPRVVSELSELAGSDEAKFAAALDRLGAGGGAKFAV